jgi:assimilatory nitrate reductase catalytic subunit
LAPSAEWWRTAPREGYWRTELAGRSAPASEWREIAALVADLGKGTELSDAVRADHRLAVLDGTGRLSAVAFLHAGSAPLPVDGEALGERFAAAALTPVECRSLLAGAKQARLRAGVSIICSCFAVGSDAICAVIATGADSAAAIGAVTRAGTNCGSCRPEINALIAASRQRSAA